jgi:Predicted AAA-ATPase/PD-(D/E)XK nuclease superfamily
MEKKFNVTGNCFPDKHYMADVSQKMAATLKLVNEGEYFIINRPRQYGKTTTLFSLSDALRKTGNYIALNMSFEGLDDAFFKEDENFATGFVDLLGDYASVYAPELEEWLVQTAPKIKTMKQLDKTITQLVNKTTKKVVILIDEVDQSSNNEVFIKFLAILRNKYLTRGSFNTFHSVVLAGVHDVKSLKMKIRPDSEQKYNSPWNIAAEFKVDMNLYPHEIQPMLDDYVRERGVQIDTSAMSYGLFYYTSGYPFLVSRLCKMIDEDLLPLKNTLSWTLEDLETAVKRIVKENNTNFESQIKHLEHNPALYEMIYRIAVDGERFSFNLHNPVAHIALLYGLLSEKNGVFAIHNRIYQEVIVNYMTSKMELQQVSKGMDLGGGYRNDDKTLNMESVLLGFQSLMKREYSRKNRDFLEKHARLVFLAFLKPIINGAGYDFKEPQISEEKRLDVVITYYEHKYIAELKLWRGQKLHEKGLIQLTDYLESQQLEEGYLLIFDHAEIKKWANEWIVSQGKRIFMIWV